MFLGSMTGLVLALVAFVGGHFLFAGTPLRKTFADMVGGEARFRLVFSLFSAVTLIWVLLAYGRAPYRPLWADTAFLRLIPVLVLPFACILLVAGFSTPNSTAVGGERAADLPDPVPGIMKITRHPFLWGVALWALAHLVANGDTASVLLFGGMAALALGGMPSIDAKAQRRMGAAWGPIAMGSSVVPFAAIISGRAKFDFAGIGWARIVVGVALYAALLLAHPWIAGKPAFL
ncbi:MAG: NnrU family protein [Rhodospirillales bacterium]